MLHRYGTSRLCFRRMTSVVVAVRVRPFNSREIEMGNPTLCVDMDGPKTEMKAEHEAAAKFTFGE